MVLIRRNEGCRRPYAAPGGLVLAICFATLGPSVDAQAPEKVAPADHRQAQADSRGTDGNPFVVRAITSAKTKEDAAQDEADRVEKYSADTWMVRLTGLLAFVGFVQAIILIIQAIVFSIQAARLKQTIDKMDEISKAQSDDMKLQTRAYLSVHYLSTVPQDNNTGWKTEVRLALQNSGRTPAHEVCYRADCAVMPFPIPSYFDYSVPNPPESSRTVLGPGQSVTMSAPLHHMLTETEIADYTSGDAKRVYIWGIVSYKDAFGDPHTTKFCQSVVWFRDGRSMGINTRHHNEAD